MTDFILYLLWQHTILRERYPAGFPRPWCADNVVMEDGVFHANWYLGWGMLAVVAAAIGALFSPLALFVLVALPALSGHAFYRECITDGHLRRIKDGTETAVELLDFHADLLTRHAGLIIPAVCAEALCVAVLVKHCN